MANATKQKARILAIDDEVNMLRALERILRSRFDLTIAESPDTAISIVEAEETPFAVAISDLQMPGMNGIQLLCRIRERAPETVRVLLTGYADVRTAISAVNDGNVFRFLSKPVNPPLLIKTLEAAVAQFDLVVSERVLLKETLHGSVRALLELLSLTNPHVFGRASIIKKRATAVAERLGVADDWQIEVASMLSQVGYVTLPPEIADKVYKGADLTSDEEAIVEGLPDVVQNLLQNIPRLESVSEIISEQQREYKDGKERIPLGARILKVTEDFGVLESQGLPPDAAVRTMKSRHGFYDPTVLDALDAELSGPDSHHKVREIPLDEVQTGMVFDEDVLSSTGMLLLARGQEVNSAILARIKNSWAETCGNRIVRVIIPITEDSEEEGAEPDSVEDSAEVAA